MMASRKLIAATIAALALFALGAWGWAGYKKVSVARESLVEHQRVLEERKQILDNIQRLSDEYKKNVGEITKFSQILPPKKSLPEMIASIDSIAQRSGVQLSDLQLLENKSAGADGTYSILSMNTTIAGSYSSLVSFLNNVEKNIRVLDVRVLDISSKEGSPILNIVVQANAYFLK